MFWSLGFLLPYSPPGFVGILLITASLNYLLKRTLSFKPLNAGIYRPLKAGIYRKLGLKFTG
jgi:hypothetical protein